MKNFLSLMLLVAFVSCSTEESSSTINSGLPGTWNLVEFNGGLAGLQCEVPQVEITWTFNEENELSFQSSPSQDDPCSQNTFLGNGTVKYGVLTHNDKKYLIIDNDEIGELTIQENEIIIDQNYTSDGGWDDGFIMKFVK